MKTFKILYKCRCGKENKIYLTKYLKKTKIVCQHCLQDKSFDDFLLANDITKRDQPRATRIKNNIPFENYDDLFKANYHKNHLDENEFLFYVNYIYQINDTVIQKIDKSLIRYIYAAPTNN